MDDITEDADRPEIPTYPDTEAGWRRRILDADPVWIDGEPIRLDPDELLSMPMVAVELARLRGRAKPYRDDTIRFYRQIGNLPVPTVQVGGHDPKPGETIPVNGQYQHTAGHTLRKTRIPRDGEKMWSPGDPMLQVAWARWVIWQWNAHRKGPGRASFPGRRAGRPPTTEIIRAEAS